MAIAITIKQRRTQLTEKVIKARQDWENTRKEVQYEVRKAHPGLKEEDWVLYWDMVDEDTRVLVAHARLRALCEAANIMGAEIF